ncbi:MAG: ribonuclease III [Salinisphaeraceae bacterium]|nr:ribonuclease III [Salinisphaeraceae bacterium]
MTSPALSELERRLGLSFKNTDLLAAAVTHCSAGKQNYERLEFLGDGILNAVIAAALFQLRKKASEGDLSRLRASLVRESTLASIARELSLKDFIQVGPGESGSHRRDSVLADVLEAIIGGVFLDSGFDQAQSLVMRLFDKRLQDLPDAESLKDAKTRLQEYLQARERPLPEYEVKQMTGPAHKRQFEVVCCLTDQDQQTTAQGTSRRRAEQAAAAAMLEQVLHVNA